MKGTCVFLNTTCRKGLFNARGKLGATLTSWHSPGIQTRSNQVSPSQRRGQQYEPCHHKAHPQESRVAVQTDTCLHLGARVPGCWNQGKLTALLSLHQITQPACGIADFSVGNTDFFFPFCIIHKIFVLHTATHYALRIVYPLLSVHTAQYTISICLIRCQMETTGKRHDKNPSPLCCFALAFAITNQSMLN